MPTTTTRRVLLGLGCTLALAASFAGGAVFAASWLGDTVKGNGTLRKQERTPGRFDAIELSLPAQVEVRLGAADGVSIETDENLLPLVETVVESGALQLRPVRRNLQLDTRTMRIVVTAKDLRRLAIGGSGTITAATLKAPSLQFEVAGSGTISVGQLQSDAVAAEISGSGTMKLAGSAKRLSVEIAGSGDMAAPQLRADDISVEIAGSGTATVWAVDALRAEIAGSGDVAYWGDARTTTAVAGSGRIKRLGATPR